MCQRVISTMNEIDFINHTYERIEFDLEKYTQRPSIEYMCHTALTKTCTNVVIY